MTDAQQALAQVREALAAGPTPGPWLTMPANAGVHCVARINAWEAVPPSDCELSHDSIDASFIAACSPANMTAILAHVKAQEAEIERLTAERDDHARWRADLADKLHDRETTISAAWEALRSAGVHSEATIDDGIRLLRRQLAEAELDAERYRWLAGHCRSTSEHWGGRWSIIVDGPAPKAHDSEDAFDAAIDAAMRLTRPAEE